MRARLLKPEPGVRLGIAFSPGFERAAVVARVSTEGLAAGAVQVGECIL